MTFESTPISVRVSTVVATQMRLHSLLSGIILSAVATKRRVGWIFWAMEGRTFENDSPRWQKMGRVVSESGRGIQVAGRGIQVAGEGIQGDFEGIRTSREGIQRFGHAAECVFYHSECKRKWVRVP